MYTVCQVVIVLGVFSSYIIAAACRNEFVALERVDSLKMPSFEPSVVETNQVIRKNIYQNLYCNFTNFTYNIDSTM